MFMDDIREDEAERLTIDTLLENRAEWLADDPFIIYGPEDRTVGYEEMNRVANQIGNSLLERGVGQQEKISLMMHHPLQTLFAFFGMQKCGAIYAPINDALKGMALSYQINDTDPSMLIVEDRYLARLNAIKDDLDTLPHVVVFETDAESEELASAFSRSTFADLRDGSSTPPDVTTTWDDVTSILYTSGTTGDPKGVVHQHRYTIYNYSMQEWIISTASGATVDGVEDVKHTSLPLYHVGGLYADVLGPMIGGATVSLWDQFSSEEFWDRIERYGATRATLLSSMIPWLMNQPESDEEHRNPLDKVTMVPLPENHREVADRFGFDFIISGYGSTEMGATTGGIIHAATGDNATPDDVRRGLSPEKFRERVQRTNFPIIEEAPGQSWIGQVWKDDRLDVAIVDDRDETLPADATGEFVVRPTKSAMIFKEYDGKPAETVEACRNLWFHSGDILSRDEAGNYYFVDRKGSVIRRRGENISSGQVQDIINAHERVKRSAAFPVPATEGGEDEVAVVVEIVDGEKLDESTLQGYLEANMPAYMVPKYLEFDEIPTSATNKMEKYKLRERLLKRVDDE